MCDVKERKKAVRKQLKEITKGLSPEYKEKASAVITEKCLSSREYAEAGSIFLYISMDGEPDTAALAKRALADGKAVYVPRCLGGGIMEAVRIRGREDLAEAPPYGILEPKMQLTATDPSEFDADSTVAFVPCVGAARDGRRLGHGAGYYDRFLEGRRMKKLMLVFGRQILDDIPCDEHDLLMDRVISEE